MKKKNILLSGIAAIVFMASTSASAIDTKAKNMILMDYTTGKYLYEKDIFEPIPPASMSKLMTVYMIFDKLRDGSLSLDDTFKVSENAWRKGGAASGGSTMFLAIGDEVSVDQILKGIIIQSGNDACIVAAENIAGDEDSFVEKMNKKATELGMTGTHFTNAHGLSDDNHYTTAYDLFLITATAMDNPLFAEIAGTATYTVAATNISSDESFIETSAFSVSAIPSPERITPSSSLCTPLVSCTSRRCAIASMTHTPRVTVPLSLSVFASQKPAIQY